VDERYPRPRVQLLPSALRCGRPPSSEPARLRASGRPAVAHPRRLLAGLRRRRAAGSKSGNDTDRRGLTRSARLLQNIYQLDQYAFETNQRKLQLSKTISLAQLAPFEFEQFRQTGVLLFATPMTLFDRDFPGHFLRLSKRVRTSVVALIPPNPGIKASLTASGVSRVMIADGSFQEAIVHRDPELVALTSPSSASGVFELEVQSDMLLPFDTMGVDTSWEVQLPRDANAFDFRTIADVLVTIAYTALHSYDYRQQVIQHLDSALSADRGFSLREQFPDPWYDLLYPTSDGAAPISGNLWARVSA
jgi:hypothetical protein